MMLKTQEPQVARIGDPYIACRVADVVMIIQNTERGRAVAAELAALPRSVVFNTILDIAAEAEQDGDWIGRNFKPDGTLGDLIVVPFTATTLPPDFPNMAFVGLGPHFADQAPAWEPAATTTETTN